MPEETLSDHVNPAWRAAMQARMARNCAMIEADEIDEGSENQDQYRLTEEFLTSMAG